MGEEVECSPWVGFKPSRRAMPSTVDMIGVVQKELANNNVMMNLIQSAQFTPDDFDDLYAGPLREVEVAMGYEPAPGSRDLWVAATMLVMPPTVTEYNEDDYELPDTQETTNDEIVQLAATRLDFVIDHPIIAEAVGKALEVYFTSAFLEFENDEEEEEGSEGAWVQRHERFRDILLKESDTIEDMVDLIVKFCRRPASSPFSSESKPMKLARVIFQQEAFTGPLTFQHKLAPLAVAFYFAFCDLVDDATDSVSVDRQVRAFKPLIEMQWGEGTLELDVLSRYKEAEDIPIPRTLLMSNRKSARDLLKPLIFSSGPRFNRHVLMFMVTIGVFAVDEDAVRQLCPNPDSSDFLSGDGSDDDILSSISLIPRERLPWIAAWLPKNVAHDSLMALLRFSIRDCESCSKDESSSSIWEYITMRDIRQFNEFLRCCAAAHGLDAIEFDPPMELYDAMPHRMGTLKALLLVPPLVPLLKGCFGEDVVELVSRDMFNKAFTEVCEAMWSVYDVMRSRGMPEDLCRMQANACVASRERASDSLYIAEQLFPLVKVRQEENAHVSVQDRALDKVTRTWESKKKTVARKRRVSVPASGLRRSERIAKHKLK